MSRSYDDPKHDTAWAVDIDATPFSETTAAEPLRLGAGEPVGRPSAVGEAHDGDPGRVGQPAAHGPLHGGHEVVGVGAAPVALDGLDPGAAVAARPADVGRQHAVAARDEHPRVELGRRRVRAVRPAVRREHHRRSLARSRRLEEEGRHAAGVHLAHDRGGASAKPRPAVARRATAAVPSSTAHTSGGLWSPVAVTTMRPAPTESADSVVSPVVAGSGSPRERRRATPRRGRAGS